MHFIHPLTPTHLHSYAPLIQQKQQPFLFKRVLFVALPFFNLYRPAAPFVTIAHACIKLETHYHQWSTNHSQSAVIKLTSCAITVGLIAATALHYRLGLLCATGQDLLNHTALLCQHIQQLQFDYLMSDVGHTLHSSLVFTSILVPTPQLIAITFITQTIFEIHGARQHLLAGRYLEGIAQIVLGCMHGYQAGQQLSNIYYQRKSILMDQLPKLQQKDLNQFVEEFKKYKDNYTFTIQPIRLGDFLRSKGLSLYLHHLDFREVSNLDLFAHVDFTGIKCLNTCFNGMRFSGTYFHDFLAQDCLWIASELSNVSFFKAKLINCDFTQASLHTTYFQQTQCERVNLHYATLNTVQWLESYLIDCNLNSSVWNRPILNHVTWINCRGEWISTTDTSLNDCDIIDCYLPKSDWIRASVHHTEIINSDYTEANWYQSTWKNSTIRSSSFNTVFFNRASFVDSYIYKTNLKYASYTYTVALNVEWKKCQLEGANFLYLNGRQASLKNCDLLDCLFDETTMHINDCHNQLRTRPVFAIACHPEIRGMTIPQVHQSIKNSQAIPLRIDTVIPEIQINNLQQEVQSILASIEPNDAIYSIPHEVLKRALVNGEIAKIKAYAADFAVYFDAIVIPGGADLEPEFYGQPRLDTTETELNYMHSILDYSLFQAAAQEDILAIGLCRGAQIGATLHNAKLIQNVDHQNSIQTYQVQGGILETIIGREITALSMHHQGIIEPINHLTVTIRHDHLVKALEHPNGLLYLFQFHIEFANSSFWEKLTPNNGYLFPFFTRLAHQLTFSKKFPKAV